MKIALISPRGIGMGSQEENKKTESIYNELSNIESLKELMACPNSPLLTIGAMATPYFDDVIYIDEEIEAIDFSKYYDVIGMSFMTQQASRAYELSVQFKKLGSYIIAGGMHPTNLPDQTLEYFDTVFVGECEDTWDQFITDFKKGCPKRIYKNNQLIDMEKVVMPRYDLLKMDAYKTIPVQISRGCPHNCTFCASTKVYGPKYRHKSVEQVINEVKYIQTLKKNPHIYFTDDNMLVSKAFSKALISSLQGMGIRWMTHTDIGIADNEDVLKLLYASGCRKLVIGFESITPASLEKLEKWKYNKLQEYGHAIEKIQSYGIGVWGTFIVGLDNDDKDVFQKVIDFTLGNNLYGAMISVPTPFPGSELYNQLDKANRILTKHWGSYTLWNVVVKPKNMSKEELEEGFEYVLKSIYSKEAAAKRIEHFKHLYCKRRNGNENNSVARS
ncbi:B12-binding domain-containing radical SAM protein [Vallitalea pronyensis]|uniref:B12-binding domain-containing radical SAM protein n=1 Tax=Vallitalea pronyensis TaxID=1348613 RepID=A0A8J8MHS2_9FIRM|nr:radical SAM protein [Vallitalea pronyensis]QUI21864.1 B12-binding domain-containing radical SAM protein [Vallitalea pronyensis]